MPNVIKEEQKAHEVKLTITVSQSEARPYLEEAALRISKEVKIKGFRPGKAPYHMVVGQVGEMRVMEEALDRIVRTFYLNALLAEGLEVTGSPDIQVTKLVPSQDIEFTVQVGLMPHVKRLANWKELVFKARPISVTDKEIDAALKDLQRMRTSEIRATAGAVASENQKLVLDLEMKKDGVPIEGGTAKGTIIYTDQESYLPGLKEALMGMKEGEIKTFALTFPSEHYQKHLAGKPVDVTATLKEIFHLELPPADDAFAKTLGLEHLTDLKQKLNENIGLEKEREEHQRQERGCLEEIAKKSQFDPIPESLIKEEFERMIDELKRNVASQGLAFDQYLSSLKKTPEELAKEMRPQAELRLHIALVLKHIAEDEKIEVPEGEIDQEIDRHLNLYKNGPNAQEQISSPTYRNYQAAILRNKKVIDLIRTTLVGGL
ncbi:MAG: Trigger factor [Parcubacteria group bacterium GW2011_GWA2_56_7]|nr:MAG: Trigger factor [Parcubacteria group bacterium GW2011_GWA2_56_7]